MRHATAIALAFAAVCLTAGFSARAEGNISETNKYAWSENAGWVNFAPANGGATVRLDRNGYLTGSVWAENVGWIKLGSSDGGPYANTASNNWGVNVESGQLSGYAWGENIGWINFNPTHGRVSINLEDGLFDGYAWAENIGWIHFRNEAPAYAVQTSARMPKGVVFIAH